MYLSQTDKMITLHGRGNGRGCSMGKTKFIEEFELPSHFPSPKEQEKELGRFEAAKDKTKKKLASVRGELHSTFGESASWVALMHLCLLDDELFCEIPKLYISQGKCAEEAASLACDYFKEKLCEGIGGENLVSLTADVTDLSKALCDELSGRADVLPSENETPPDCILLCPSPLPSFIAKHRASLSGIVCDGTSLSPSVSALSEALGIPTVYCDGETFDTLTDKNALIDSDKGYLYVSPDLAAMERIANKEESEADGHRAVTAKGGKKLLLFAELSDLFNTELLASLPADGIGMLKSEQLYLESNGAPDEETLFEHYRAIAEIMPTKPVIIRAFQTSGTVRISKMLSKKEGAWQDTELYIFQDKTLRIQLRAIMRAAVYGRISLVLPSSDYGEICRYSLLKKELCEELHEEKREFCDVNLGAVISTPAAAIMCEKIFKTCDFLIVDKEKLAAAFLSRSEPWESADEIGDEALRSVLSNITRCANRAKKFAILSLGKHTKSEDISLAATLSFKAVNAPFEVLAKFTDISTHK